MFIENYQEIIIKQLGEIAWEHIYNGRPVIANGYVWFWIQGQECAWGIDTDPVLLIQTETDKEFQTFTDLLEEICGKSQSQSAALSRHH